MQRKQGAYASYGPRWRRDRVDYFDYAELPSYYANIQLA